MTNSKSLLCLYNHDFIVIKNNNSEYEFIKCTQMVTTRTLLTGHLFSYLFSMCPVYARRQCVHVNWRKCVKKRTIGNLIHRTFLASLSTRMKGYSILKWWPNFKFRKIGYQYTRHTIYNILVCTHENYLFFQHIHVKDKNTKIKIDNNIMSKIESFQ